MKKRVLAILLMCMLAVPCAGTAKGAAPTEDAALSTAEMYDRGLDCYNAGDYAGAAAWWQQAAEAGDASAMADLGYLYRHGLGVNQDDTLAASW